MSRGVGSFACSRLTFLVALGLLAFGCNRIETRIRPTPSGPNVLLVTIDTLRADYVGVTARHKTETPTLDRLAAEGALYENASATVPLTLPSHTSILTGQFPPHHGVRHNSIYRLADEKETVAERFQAAGYSTGAFVAAAVLGREFGLAQGFDEYADKMSAARANSGGFEQLPASAVSDEAIAWLQKTDRPFFLWVHYYDAHANYEPPEPFRSRLAPNPYAGEVAYVDFELGRLLDALRASDRYANTVVVVTADHGEGLGEHGERTHTYLIYESTMHVPLIVRGPGVPAGKRVADVVSNAAVAPTLLALAGLPPLADADTVDVTPLARGEKIATEWAYSESLAGQLDHGWAPIFAVRARDEKYIHAPRPELFDLATDAHEKKNLLESDAAAQAQRVALAEQRLGAVKEREQASTKVAIDAETRANIEALGYVVPSGEHAASAKAEDPKDVERYAQLAFSASALLEDGKVAEAERVARKGLEKLPNSVRLHEILARIYLTMGRRELGLAAAHEAARLAPDSIWALGLEGEVRLQLGDYAGGTALMERVLALDPDQAGAHFAMMSKLKIGGSIEEAEMHAKRGLELAGDDPKLVEACGEAWEMAGEYERANAAYLEGIARAKEPPTRLHMRLAIQYARLGDDEKFAEQIAQAGDAASDERLVARLGIVYAARREPEKAEPIFRSLVMRDRTHFAQRMLARLLRENGRVAEANRIAPLGAPARAPEPILEGLAPPAAPRG